MGRYCLTIPLRQWYNNTKYYENEGDEQMTNVILFLNSFLSYLLLFILIVALVIIACVIGVKWRKSKDRKLAVSGGAELEQSASGNENV